MRRGRIGRARLALGCAVVALAAAAAPAAATALAPCNGDSRLCDRTLDRVVLPATHNSMSNAAAGWQIPNQQVGIPEQLDAGVRGFLIDTYYAHRDANGALVTDPRPRPTSQLYLCHVACSLGATPLIDALRGIRRFLRDAPAQRARVRQRGLHAAGGLRARRCAAAACAGTSTEASSGRAGRRCAS